MEDDAIEDELESISGSLARALEEAGGDASIERSAIRRAIDRFVATPEAAGQPDGEHFAGHFLVTDGIGWRRRHEPALLRPRAPERDVERWIDLVEEEKRSFRRRNAGH